MHSPLQTEALSGVPCPLLSGMPERKAGGQGSTPDRSLGHQGTFCKTVQECGWQEAGRGRRVSQLRMPKLPLQALPRLSPFSPPALLSPRHPMLQQDPRVHDATALTPPPCPPPAPASCAPPSMVTSRGLKAPERGQTQSAGLLPDPLACTQPGDADKRPRA